jgi:hypothetical protein
MSVAGMYLSDFPELLAQFDLELNEGVETPRNIRAGSARRYWWRCNVAEDHVWESPVNRRTIITKGCPFCSGQRVSVTNSLATKFPEIASQLDSDMNDGLTASDVTAFSKTRVWWRCDMADDHIWYGPINTRTGNAVKWEGGGSCPFCQGKRVCLSNSVFSTHPHLVEEWDWEKNSMTPKKLVAKSNKEVHFICSQNSEHRWSTSLSHRTSGTGCPYCAGMVADSDNNLAMAYPEIASQWVSELNAGVTPSDVTPYSNRRFWWKCDVEVDHIFDCTVYERTRIGIVCPMCYGRRVVESNCLATTHPDLASEWHPSKNSISPTEVTRGSNLAVWWYCSDHGHEWKTTPNSRDLPGCPLCPKKNQTRLFEIVRSIFVHEEVLFDFRHPELIFSDSGARMELDIWLPRLKLAFEYQGEQHFPDFYSGLFSDPDLPKRDEEKRKACLELGVKLIEIDYRWDKSRGLVEQILDENSLLP